MIVEEPQQIIVSEPKHVVFWQAHAECLSILAGLGINFNLTDRLKPFRLINDLEKILRDVRKPDNEVKEEVRVPLEAKVIDAISHVGRLVKYRIEGFEPAFKDDKYV